MLNHILVPLDGSELAERALTYARQIVSKDGQIDLLTVIDAPEYPTSVYYPAGLPAFDLTRTELQRDVVPQAEEYLNRLAETLRSYGYKVTVEVAVGEAATAIVEHANERETDAIVMSTHGRSGLSRWLFGSVANKVLTSVCIPVFVIPAKKFDEKKTKDAAE